MGTKNGKWDGNGVPPSRRAAINWLVDKGVPRDRASEIVGQAGTLAKVGERARDLKGGEGKKRGGLRMPSFDASDIPSLGDLGKGLGKIPDRLDDLLPGSMPAPRSSGGGKKKASSKNAPAGPLTDANGDGRLSDDIQARAAAGDEDIAAAIAAGPGGATDTRGAPLWPYKGSEETLGDITVENRSLAFAWGPRPQRVGARYFETDTLSPLRWSAEDRANLQRVMHGLGLYGDKKIRLGSWTADDQTVFAEVLAHSNIGGMRWHETLAGWKQAGLPPELQDELKSGQPVRGTIQVTNPVDIRAAAKTVSQELTGAVDRGFVEGAAAPYQGLQTAAQSGVYGDQEGGGGGTVTQAPSMSAFMEDKLRREKPLEVDGYQFLGQFEQFLSMLGAQ